VRKRKQKGTGYKYIDGPPAKALPSETVITAMKQAKLANDRYKFQSVFVRELIRLYGQILDAVENETSLDLSAAEHSIVNRRRARLLQQAQTLSGSIARLLWGCPPADKFLSCISDKVNIALPNVHAIVFISNYVLDKLTAPESA